MDEGIMSEKTETEKMVATELGIKGLVNPEALQKSIDGNDDGYGGACVQVAINVMKHLDTFEGEFNIGYHPDMTTPHGIVCACDDQGGITGFMAGAARNIVAVCYKDGWKFWLADVYSKYDIDDEGNIRDLDKRVGTLTRAPDLDVTEEQIRTYVQELFDRYEKITDVEV